MVKHARATRVSLQVEQQDDQVEFQVTDNGVGFRVSDWIDEEACKDRGSLPGKICVIGGVPFRVSEDGKSFKAVPQSPGKNYVRKMGLALMEGRIQLLGGALTITSEAGAATSIAFTVPVDKGRMV